MTAELILLAGNEHRWILPTCAPDCAPQNHNPHHHEAVGERRALSGLRPAVVKTGPLVVDMIAEQATVNGEVISLSRREWAMLAYYAANIGRPCTHEDTLAAAWGPEWRRDDTHIVRTNMLRLRKKLGIAAPLLDNGMPGSYCLRYEEPS